MSPFLALTGVSIKSVLLTTLNIGRSKRKSFSIIGAFSILALIMILISVSYSFSMAAVLAQLGGLDLVLITMVLVSLFLPTAFILFTVQSHIFSSKDIDLLFSLPLSTFTIMLARLAALYLEVLFMVELLLLPAGAAWLFFGGTGGFAFLLLLFVIGFFLSFIPVLIALLFGAFISLLVSKLKYKNVFITLFSLLAICTVLYFSFHLSAGPEVLNLDMAKIQADLLASFAPLVWFLKGVTTFHLPSLLLVASLTAIPFFATVWLFSLFYKPLLTLLSSHTLHSNYKIHTLQVTSNFMALFKKEAGRFFGTPTYILNSGVGILILIVGSVVAVIQKSTIQNSIQLFSSQIQGINFYSFAPAVLLGAIFVTLFTVTPTAVSISLEGNTLWILKSAPIDTFKIFAAKIGFGISLSAIGILIAALLGGYALSIPLPQIFLVIMVCLLFSTFTAALGLYINLELPRMDGANDTIIIKQSASLIIYMLATLLFTGLFLAIYILCVAIGFGFYLFSAISIVLLILLNSAIVYLLNTRGRKLFQAL